MVMTRRRSIRLKKFLLRHLRFAVPIIFAFFALVTGGIAYVLHQYTGISDAQRIEDLVKIDNAITFYPGGLPAKLTDVYIHDLHGKTSDYKYGCSSNPNNVSSDKADSCPKANRSYNGGPTIGFEVCASFKTSTLKVPEGRDGFTVDNEVNAYIKHRKGLQCYGDSFYKDGSHISPILKESELAPIPPTKTSQPDINAFFARVQSYYQAHMRLLGAPAPDSELKKMCVKLTNKSTFSTAPGGQVFRCRIEVQKEIPAPTNITQGRNIMNQLLTLTAQEGFQYPFTKEGPLSDRAHYYMSIEPENNDCKVETDYSPNMKPAPVFFYRLTCMLPFTAEVQPGYQQVNSEDSPI
jgi:hypothetical protein